MTTSSLRNVEEQQKGRGAKSAESCFLSVPVGVSSSSSFPAPASGSNTVQWELVELGASAAALLFSGLSPSKRAERQKSKHG